MLETKALTTLKNFQVEDIFKDEKTCDETLEAIKEFALSVTFDTSTSKGRKDCVSHAADVKRSVKTIKEKALELTNGFRNSIKEVNNMRDKASEFLRPIADEIRAPVTAWENEEKLKKEKEEKRIAAIQERIDALSCHKPRNDKDVPIPAEQASAEQLDAAIKELTNLALLQDLYDEFLEEAADVKTKRIDELSAVLKFRKEQDELAVKEEALRKEREEIEEEKKRIEEEKEEQRQFAEAQEVLRKTNLSALVNGIARCGTNAESSKDFETAIKELTQIVVDDSYQEREEEAIRLKAQKLIDLENDLIAALEREQKEAEKEEKRLEREAEKKAEDERRKEAEENSSRTRSIDHRRKINREVIAIFESTGLNRDQAIKVLKAILQTRNEHITINY
jgi:hypothetical protein